MAKISDLPRLYHARYTGEMRFLTSYPGTHSLVYHVLRHRLEGAELLDVGCGAGRFALMCAQLAKHVMGVDYVDAAIDLAKIAALLVEAKNVEFARRRADDIQSLGSFDIITLLGTLEHIPEPQSLLAALKQQLKPGGTLLVTCPGFLNFRGYMWMTLQELFDLTMSPTDIWQICPNDIMTWARAVGLHIESQIGLWFDWGWTERAVNDMKRRVRLAVRDKRRDHAVWGQVEVDFDAFDRYLSSQLSYHHDLLRYLQDHGIMQSVSAVSLTITGSCEKVDQTLLAEFRNYLADGPMSYVSKPPFNAHGAETLYILRRIGEPS